jgi:hypothetical protein
MIPDDAFPMARDLYQQALDLGASPTNAAYLVGSAYQESSFNPNERDDFVGGKPTSFGLMQVGSPSLGSGSVPDQFKNYITAMQNHAPDTWAAMNAAATPEAAHVALHQNPDWRMGIPGARFENASQLLGSTDQGQYQNLPSYLQRNPPTQLTQPTTWQQIMGPLASPPPQQSMLNTGGYQNLPAYLAQPAAAATPAQPSTTDQFATNFGKSLTSMAQNQMAQQQAQGNQMVQSLLSRQPSGAAALAQLAANPQAFLQNPYLQRVAATGPLPGPTYYYARGGVVPRPLYAQQGTIVPARPVVVNRAPMPMVPARPAVINRAPVPMPSRPPLYLQRGAVVPGRPTAMDTVRAMLSPGEMVLNRQQEQAVRPIRGKAGSLRPDQLQALARARSRLAG